MEAPPQHPHGAGDDLPEGRLDRDQGSVQGLEALHLRLVDGPEDLGDAAAPGIRRETPHDPDRGHKEQRDRRGGQVGVLLELSVEEFLGPVHDPGVGRGHEADHDRRQEQRGLEGGLGMDGVPFLGGVGEAVLDGREGIVQPLGHFGVQVGQGLAEGALSDAFGEGFPLGGAFGGIRGSLGRGWGHKVFRGGQGRSA